jgi:hypothetical protein
VKAAGPTESGCTTTFCPPAQKHTGCYSTASIQSTLPHANSTLHCQPTATSINPNSHQPRPSPMVSLKGCSSTRLRVLYFCALALLAVLKLAPLGGGRGYPSFVWKSGLAASRASAGVGVCSNSSGERGVGASAVNHHAAKQCSSMQVGSDRVHLRLQQPRCVSLTSRQP